MRDGIGKGIAMGRSPLVRAALAGALLAWAGAGAGCGEDLTVADVPLAGRIDGMAWTLADAESNAFLSDGRGELFVDMYERRLDPACSGFGTSSPRHLILSVPKSTGAYALSTTLNATFVIETPGRVDNLVATRGRLEIDEVTSTAVRGGVHVVLDGDNELNGKFEIRVCPLPP